MLHRIDFAVDLLSKILKYVWVSTSRYALNIRYSSLRYELPMASVTIDAAIRITVII